MKNDRSEIQVLDPKFSLKIFAQNSKPGREEYGRLAALRNLTPRGTMRRPRRKRGYLIQIFFISEALCANNSVVRVHTYTPRGIADGLFTRLAVRNSQRGCVSPRGAPRVNKSREITAAGGGGRERGAPQRRRRRRRRRRRKKGVRRRKEGVDGPRRTRRARESFFSFVCAPSPCVPCVLVFIVIILHASFFFLLSFFLFLRARMQLSLARSLQDLRERNKNSRDFQYFTNIYRIVE